MSESNLAKPSKWMQMVRTLGLIVLVTGGVAAIGWVLLQRQAQKEADARNTPEEKTQQSAQPIRITQAHEDRIQAWVFAEGTSRSVRREYLTFNQPGKVVFIKPSREGGELRAGEKVQAKDVLAKLDYRHFESEINSASATVDEAKTQLEVSQSDIAQAETQESFVSAKFRRAELLMKQGAISKEAYDEAKADLDNAKAVKVSTLAKLKATRAGVLAAEAKLRQAEIDLEETVIVSPIDGIIAYLNIEEGYYFTQNNIKTTSESDALQTVPIVVIDPTAYEITLDIPSFEAGRVRVGNNVVLIPGGTPPTAAFQPESSPNAAQQLWRAHGKVYSINPAVNPGGRSIQLKIRSTQGAEHLRDGMFVACWIEVESKPDAIVAPFDAFLFEENRPYVFVVDPSSDGDKNKGIARRVPVQIGLESLTHREIVAGVKAGEQLATDGRYRLVDKAPVRLID